MAEWDEQHRPLSYNPHDVSVRKTSFSMCMYSFVCKYRRVLFIWDIFLTGTTPGHKCVGVLYLHVYWMCLCARNDNVRVYSLATCLSKLKWARGEGQTWLAHVIFSVSSLASCYKAHYSSGMKVPHSSTTSTPKFSSWQLEQPAFHFLICGILFTWRILFKGKVVFRPLRHIQMCLLSPSSASRGLLWSFILGLDPFLV